ncbi:SDR family NAD(P)-dependent oxidoreductase [Chloroflexota bacterium]
MSIPSFSLAGQVAVVTGGRRGIGRAIALAFAEAGADVAICDCIVEGGELEAVAEEIQGLGQRSLSIYADVSQKTDVDNVVQKVVDEFGAIDILVNNAGILISAPILEMAEAEWDKVINIDLKGYFLCSQAVGKRMVEQNKGSIINIASQSAFRTVKERGAYSIAKAGVVMLTRLLARELGSYNIRANAIAPGLVMTEMGRPTWSNPEKLKQREAVIPLGRVAETGDIIGTALFLASDASSYVSGHTIVAGGGELA